jgi:hypothetical protein
MSFVSTRKKQLQRPPLVLFPTASVVDPELFAQVGSGIMYPDPDLFDKKICTV